MSDDKFKLIKLDNDNYVIWKWQFMNVLRAKKIEKVLNANHSDVDQSNKALAILGSALSEENMLKIVNCTTFMDAWRSIERVYENKTSYEPQALFRRLNSFRMENVSEVSSGLSEMQGIVAQLANLGEKVSDNCLIGAILSALPSSFEIFITVWKNSAHKNVENLVSKIMAEVSEQMIKDKEETRALAAKAKTYKREKVELNKNQCRYCKESGHWIAECPNLKEPYDPNRRNRKRQDGNNNSNNSKSHDKTLAFITRAPVSASGLNKDTWVADSGCTNHMSPFKELFSSMSQDYAIKHVQLADEVSIAVEGSGSIVTKQGIISNVLYVPNLAQNLFSIAAAANAGITHIGTKDKITFYHKDEAIFTANMRDNLYVIKFDYVNQSGKAYAATLKEWHARFGHVAMDTIMRMKKNSVVDGLEIVNTVKPQCDECKLNKCTQAHHPTRTTLKSIKSGSVLHLDTAGPSNVLSHGNSRYFVLCKDEASGFRQVAFVATKDQIPSKVKQFIARATLETGNPVLKIVSDNGTEFRGELSKFLEQRGIIHETSVAGVPNQNGFIERDIRTIKEAAKTLLNKSKMNKIMWAEAVNCAAYTMNRVINASNEKQTPYELWYGHKPNVKNLRIFGERAIIKKAHNKHETSWDEKGSQALFMGYTDRSNTYRFLENNKVKITCDAVFLNKLIDGDQSIAQSKQDDGFWCDSGSDNQDDHQEVIASASSESEQETIFESQSQQDSDEFILCPQANSSESTHEDLSTVNIIQESSQAQGSTAQADGNGSSQDELQAFVNRHRNETIEVKQGNMIMKVKLGDLTYSQPTKRWKIPTGHFISKKYLNEVKDKIIRQPKASFARALLVSAIIPRNYEEAATSTNQEEWKNAMDDEIDSLIENDVFEVVQAKNVQKKPVQSRWVYTIKTKANGEIEKFKARVVAKGFSQIYGVDYFETYCSVVHILSTRLLINYAAINKLLIRQFDIKTAFLYGRLHETIFMNPPDGYAEPDTLWRLKRSLYGLKQSPRMWNEYFSEFIKKLGFKTADYDNSIFFRLNPLTFIMVYVDDGLIISKCESDINCILKELHREFQMREMDVNKYRGLQIDIRSDGIFIHQESYAKKILDAFNMSNAHTTANPVSVFGLGDAPLDKNVPYKSAVSSLAYLADTTRPDISFAVNQLQRKMANPTIADWKRTKQVFRYIAGTTRYGIMYKSKPTNCSLIGYSDSDFAGDYDSSKSTTGFVILFNDAPIHWKSQLQQHVTLSSTEAEVIALCSLSKQLSWIRRMAIQLQIMPMEAATIKCDNQSALKIAQSEKATLRTRHLRAQDAYIREQIEEDELQLEHVRSANQLADILTKRVRTTQFEANRNMLLVEAQ